MIAATTVSAGEESPNFCNLPEHEAARLLPMMGDAELRSLASDIQANGLRNRIVLYRDGDQLLMLDGRNRALACRSIGVAPRWELYEGTNPIGFVMSQNVARRHLSDSQRAMVAARLATLGEGRPAQLWHCKCGHGNRASSRWCEDADCGLARSAQAGPPETAPIGAVSQEAAAQLLKVSRRNVQRARVVRDSGDEKLIKLVEQDKVSVSAAAIIAVSPPEERAAKIEQIISDSRVEPQGRVERAAHRRRAVKRLHDHGLGTAEISRSLGIASSVISHDKKTLGVLGNEPSVRLQRSIERLTNVLEGTVLQAEKITDQLSQEAPASSEEEVASWIKRLSAITASINRLRSALRSSRQ